VNEAGLWEEMWLWSVPYGFVALLTILMFVASFCLLMYAKFHSQKRVRFFDSLISLAFLSVAFILETAMNYYFSFQDHNYAIWASYCLYLSDPLSSTFIPITLLFAIHLPLSCRQKKYISRTQGTPDEASVTNSIWNQQPSHTTWHGTHSPYEVSEVTSLAKDQNQQEYGTLM